VSLRNWDNETWLSSKRYIQLFNDFLLKQVKLNRNSKILDVGCGRGKILGSLSSRLKLKSKPIGIDIERHRDRDKRINFKKVNAIDFIKKNKKKFDLIMIKQTIHLLKYKEIKKLIYACKMQLNQNGKILILSLETSNNEIPTFLLMKKKLKKSLDRDKKIIKYISKLYPKNKNKRFSFKVKISRDKYIEMIKNRYISTLLGFSLHDIFKGINQINLKYKKILSFNDKLICLILDK
jgi:cyclopropane fatty-acyl-phospholipid synthase-like methyltransferase